MNRRAVVALYAVLAGSLVACGTSSSRETPAPPREAPSGPRTETPPAPPAPEGLAPATPVTFQTADGVTISASLRAGATPDAPAVVLVHKLGSTREEWGPLVEHLSRAPALTTLAIDLRGHGGSTHGPGGRALSFDAFGPDEWRATALDVRAAVDFLLTRAPVHPSRVAAVGASIGSTAVLAAAAEEPRIVAVVALSPGRAYHGFDAITPATHLGERPVLALAATDETDSVDMANTLGRVAHRGVVLTVDGSAHGVDIFATHPAMLERVDDFLRTALAPPPPMAPPPTSAPAAGVQPPPPAAPPPGEAAPPPGLLRTS